ncbi:MAG TPA: efflux transporter outer membrane subunit [Acidobacteriaceae bacterium]|nr:efflux transporter outer membrane subunit [Acidobacteriaceae bacterium]
MISARSWAASVLLLTLCACKVGPNYQRPAVRLPDQYRGLAPNLAPAPAPAETFGEMKWWTVFQDKVLEDLIREALTNNYDMQIAAARVAQAKAIVGITRADQLPSVSGGGGIQQVKSQLFPGGPTFDSVSVQASYILDFWGQYRRATEAARANLVATQFGQNVVRTSLISDLASAYFHLRQYDAQLEYSEKTLAADQDMLKLNTTKYKGGESAKTDVLQAQLLVEQSEAQIISLHQLIEQTENAISVLVGRDPGSVGRGISLTEQPHMPEIPAGLPSTLLTRRPDVRRAEMQLVSANANVGVAKAAFFPQFSLTGQYGLMSTSVTSFIAGPATFWSMAGQALQPIYEGGRIRSNYKLAWAKRDEAEVAYRQSVQLAMRDVSNSLVGYSQSRQYRAKLQEQTDTYFEAAHLANVRFTGGATSFLEVLVTQQQYFTSQLALAQAWNDELQNYLQLYQALGGGWDM